MDFDFPPDDDPRRLEVRSWIEKNQTLQPKTLLTPVMLFPIGHAHTA